MRLGVLLLFFCAVNTVSAVIDDSDPHFIVEIGAKDVYERSIIASVIHIDSVIADRVFAIVHQEDLKAVVNHKDIRLISAEMIGDDGSVDGYYHPFLSVIDFPDADTAFHTYDEALSLMRDLEKTHGDLVKVFSIGKSMQGRDIWAIKIGKNNDDGSPKKGIAFMATHHAREHVSTEMPLLFAKDLLGKAGTDQEVDALLDKTEIYLIPLVNPDGAIYDITGKRYRWWRKNRRQNVDGSFGVDLNRNYGYGWGTGGSSSTPSSDIFMGTEAFSEPETKAIKDFFVEHPNVTIALSFHTFSELVLYPWGGRHEGVGGQDELLFKKMASDITKMNNYTPMQSSELYIASGDTCDWLYGELSVYCFTFELSPASMFEGGFYPGASIIDAVFRANLLPMMYLANLADNPQKALE